MVTITLSARDGVEAGCGLLQENAKAANRMRNEPERVDSAFRISHFAFGFTARNPFWYLDSVAVTARQPSRRDRLFVRASNRPFLAPPRVLAPSSCARPTSSPPHRLPAV